MSSVGQQLESNTAASSSQPTRTSLSPPDINTPKVRINVSGTVVETYVTTLARFPRSLLGDADRRHKYWDEKRDEYVLDRHVPSFEAIFQFYQTGILQRPYSVPLFTFVEELEYYEFDRKIIDAYKSKEGFLIEKMPEVTNNGIKMAIWLLLEHPKSSPWARILAVLSVAVICLSVACYCAETMPQFTHVHCQNVTFSNEQRELVWSEVPNTQNIFFLIETGCVIWFTLELILRFLCCPNKRTFLCNKLNIIDIVTVVPYTIFTAFIFINQSCYFAKRSAGILIFRIVRVFRIIKLTKHFRILHIYILCLKYSLRELRIFMYLVLTGCVILAVAVYVAEVDQPDTMIDSIPEGIWWAVATMTTVGYGDVYPIGLYGRLVGVLCFITGCLVVALPSPPIVSNFNHFYRVETGRNCDEPEV